MRNDLTQRAWLLARLVLLMTLAFILTGCFQSAGDGIVPTSVDLTAIAPLQYTTPFVTPLSTGGFIPPTDDPNNLFTPTDIPIVDQNSVSPTVDPNVVTDITSVSPTAFVPETIVPTAAVATLIPTPTALPTEGPCVHTVQQGEWLYSIARKYNIAPDDLLAANPQLAGNPDKLSPGDVLNIPNCNQGAAPTATGAAVIPPTANAQPAGNTLPTATIELTDRIYNVAAGDTLGAIARKFNTTVQAIRDANGLTSDALSIGQQLKIPKPTEQPQ